MLSMARQTWHGRQVSPVHCWHGRQVNKQIPIHVGPDGETCSTKIASLELVYFDSNMSTLLNNGKQQIWIASSNWWFHHKKIPVTVSCESGFWTIERWKVKKKYLSLLPKSAKWNKNAIHSFRVVQVKKTPQKLRNCPNSRYSSIHMYTSSRYTSIPGFPGLWNFAELVKFGRTCNILSTPSLVWKGLNS